jgi:hypothetical protein
VAGQPAVVVAQEQVSRIVAIATQHAQGVLVISFHKCRLLCILLFNFFGMRFCLFLVLDFNGAHADSGLKVLLLNGPEASIAEWTCVADR